MFSELPFIRYLSKYQAFFARGGKNFSDAGKPVFFLFMNRP